MNTLVDGTEVVATRADAEALDTPPLLILEVLTDYLDAHGLGSGEIGWQLVGDGQSNITYLLQRGGQRFVLRRGPRPPLPKSTHDMMREARIQKLLGPTGVAVPKILAVCEDETLLGVPFYIMEFLGGEVITDQLPAVFDTPSDKRALSTAMVDGLLDLHAVDVTAGEISKLGRPEGYLQRQVARFSGLWPQTSTRDVPQVARIGEKLAANIPETQKYSVVHGDFRMGNLMYQPDAPPKIQAILDWEMATLGDPLADVGYLVATYAEPGSTPPPLWS